MDDIEALVDAVEECRKEVDHARQKLGRAERALEEALVARASYQVGEVVEVTLGRAEPWRAAIVRSIEPNFYGRAKNVTYWYEVSTRRKDGQWAEPRRRIYSEKEIRKVPADDAAQAGPA